MVELVTLARPYAKAVFAQAQATNTLDQWSEKLSWLSVMATDTVFSERMHNPTIASTQLLTDMSQVMGEQFDASCASFIKILIENSRLDTLPAIARLFEQYKATAQQTIEVQMISAFDVTDEQNRRFSDLLGKRFGQQVKLQCLVDSTLIGGAIIRAGDNVIDGSLSGKLSRLMQTLNQS